MTGYQLQKARLSIPFTVRMSKGRLRRGQQCHLIEYILFASRQDCDLCGTSYKAERQVIIEHDGGRMHSGLNCLEDVSGISAKQLEHAVKGNLSIALKLRNLSRTGFTDEVAMIRKLREVVEGVGQNKEVPQIAQELARMEAQPHFRRDDLQRLEHVIDHLALLRFAHENPAGYRLMLDAVFNHPGPRAKEALINLRRDQFNKPAGLRVFQSVALQKAMRTIREPFNPTLQTPEVHPWAYGSREAYHGALRSHYTQRADEGQLTGTGPLQLQHDFIHLERRRVTPADLFTNLTVPCVYPLYDTPDIREQNLPNPQSLRLIERANRLESGSLTEQVYVSDQLHSAVVRTDPERARWTNRGLKPALPEDTTSAGYVAFAVWRPDPWHATYAQWQQYGRDTLLTFPTLN